MYVPVLCAEIAEHVSRGEDAAYARLHPVTCCLLRTWYLCRYVYLRLVDLKVDLTGRVGLHQPYVWTGKVDLKVDQTEINIPTLV